VKQLATEYTPWTDFAILNRIHPLSVVGPQEILLHNEYASKHLQRECCARLAIFSVVDYQTEVVELKQEAEVSDWTILA
jgi:hypothetical protein